ncbi:uncharacterized protein PAE49_006926 [Odontesthes bonariensis]|uniref:uncharacterized protein LOC142382782 n=1 Tax=Odontesthes bonariensis TaxID=219752 RepID=UPI003F5855DE
MPGMTVTFILIASLLSPCCQLLIKLALSVFMAPRAAFLALSVCFGLFSSSDSAEELGCFKVNSCKCIMKDGSGVINLKAMGDTDGLLGRLRAVPADAMWEDAEVLLSFSPCHHFSQPEDPMGSDCTNVAVCLVVRYEGLGGYVSRYISYGRHEGNEFQYNHTLKTLSVSYFARSEQQPVTVVHYHCSPSQSVSIIRDQSLSARGPLQIWVESPCACPNACAMGDLGVGTIFLIILSLSAAAYFILGSCALRPFRGNSGVQISPEPSVWCTICYLCSDGEANRPPRGRYTDLTHSER